MYLRKVSGWQGGAVFALGVVWSLQSPPSTAAPGPGGSARPGSLEARLQRLEDKDEIHDLLIEYGRLLDDGDWVGYSQLFARQGTWTGSFGTATGPAEILAMLRKTLGAAPPHDPNQVRSFHLMTNCVIRVDGDRATATSRWTNFARTDDNKLTPRLAGHYVDVLVREDGKWKFLTRQAPRDIPNPETAAEAGKAP